jgi:hypothetical protein
VKYCTTCISFKSKAQEPLVGQGPTHYWDFTISLIHTTNCRTSLDEWSASHTDIYLTTHSTQKGQNPFPRACFFLYNGYLLNHDFVLKIFIFGTYSWHICAHQFCTQYYLLYPTDMSPPAAKRSEGVGLRPIASQVCGFEYRHGHGCLCCSECIVCFQV